MTRLKAQHRQCDQCGAVMRPAHKEGYDSWITRRFCSVECQRREAALRSGVTKTTAETLAIRLKIRKDREAALGIIHVRIPAGTVDGVPLFRIRIRTVWDDDEESS